MASYTIEGLPGVSIECMSMPPASGYPQPYGSPYGPPPDHPQATTILVLGILGLVFCQLFAPVAWFLGRKALAEIDASGGAIGGRSNVKAGYICGVIGTILMLLVVIGVVAIIVISLVVASTSPS
ncbi:hypothetical protein DFR74_110156 [Nocardia puris]|uniref:DUF4190 domain-containing protein n=2 Tax=Nocardia puris TaxID=208602 RepID=A0A366DCX1_9NOCA|nr:hypothetical protein DFR74_110156 [Nocardia puris]